MGARETAVNATSLARRWTGVPSKLSAQNEQCGHPPSHTGQFIELDRPRRLRFSWSCSDWPDPSVQSEVTVTLEDHGADETLMTIEHEQLPPEQADTHQRGWGAIAVQLGEALRARG